MQPASYVYDHGPNTLKARSAKRAVRKFFRVRENKIVISTDSCSLCDGWRPTRLACSTTYRYCPCGVSYVLYGGYPDLREGTLYNIIVQIREVKSAGPDYTKFIYFHLWMREKASYESCFRPLPHVEPLKSGYPLYSDSNGTWF